MDSMSHDPAAGDIGSQLVDIGSQGLDSGATTLMSATSLIPAGGEEVSLQAALAFSVEAAQMLASNTAAQEELMRAGTALMDIARMYNETDDTAAGALGLSGAQLAANQLAQRSGANLAAGLARAEALPGAAASAARTPLLAGLIDKPPITGEALSNIANAGSSAVGAGTAPLSSVGQGGAAAGGAVKPTLASVDDQDEDDGNGEDDKDGQPTGQRVI